MPEMRSTADLPVPNTLHPPQLLRNDRCSCKQHLYCRICSFGGGRDLLLVRGLSYAKREGEREYLVPGITNLQMCLCHLETLQNLWTCSTITKTYTKSRFAPQNQAIPRRGPKRLACSGPPDSPTPYKFTSTPTQARNQRRQSPKPSTLCILRCCFTVLQSKQAAKYSLLRCV